MSFWAAVQCETRQEHVAQHFLRLHGYELYAPRIQVRRAGSRAPVAQSLFLNYAFIVIEIQWHSARWCPGVVRLVMDGERPARVPDAAIAELRAKERNGFVVLPKVRGLERGDSVRVKAGPFTGHLAIYDSQRPHERVAILLTLLGSQQRVEMLKRDVERIDEPTK